MRSLIIDDNEEFAEMLKIVLEPYMAVDYAPNGTEGVKQFCSALKADLPYEVIFLDLQMPMRDGLETVRSIRSIESRLMMGGALGTKILVVTGHPGTHIAAKAMLAGCVGVVAKTAGPRAILQKLSDLSLIDVEEAPEVPQG